MKKELKQILFTFLVTMLTGVALWANVSVQIVPATTGQSNGSITVMVDGDQDGYTLTLSGPDGFEDMQNANPRETIAFTDLAPGAGYYICSF